MNIYLVRHGKSEGNLNKTHQNETTPLSSQGQNQAKVVAKRLKIKKIDVIYASPYQRAKETAEIINQELNLPINYWDDLKEIKKPSAIANLALDDPGAEKIKKAIYNHRFDPSWKHSDEESFNEFYQRAGGVAEELLAKHPKEEVLCVTHVKTIIMIILSSIFKDKLTPEIFWQFHDHCRLDNTGITRLEFSPRFGWDLVTWNDITHL